MPVVEAQTETVTSEVPQTILYWSPGNISRYQFLDLIQTKLERGGWVFKTDTGWTTHDIEIAAHLWTQLRLTTVSEELEQGKRNFHCRIEGFWSLPAKLFATLLFGIVIVLIWRLAHVIPWIWMSLTALPLVCWLLDDERQAHGQALGLLIEEAAKDQSLTRLQKSALP